jgi:hypothetical protein
MAHTRIVQYENADTTGFRTGVSLHAHTNLSMETLEFLPGWTARLPVISGFVGRQIARRERSHGAPLDFSRAYWRPPLPPRAVLESECDQIRERFDLPALVSLTDHDSIDAGLAVNALDPDTPHPVAVEWTVTFRGSTFHLGVHNLPRAEAQPIMQHLRSCTEAPVEAMVGATLEWLHAMPSVLIVLNHPLWNARHDLDQNHETLTAFVSRFCGFLHATEINGYRKPAENSAVVELARDWNLPVLAGGDRHGRAPNAMLNLTRATTFSEFVQEVRHEAVAMTVILPEYREHPTTRVLETVGDVLRHDALLDPGQQRWSDRVFVITDDGRHAPLSSIWQDGAPWWVRASVRTARILGSAGARQALRFGLPSEAEGVL